jgi:translation elongation factor EF-Tu-like GTPase
VTRRWEGTGLTFRLTHAETGARVYGVVPAPGHTDAVCQALAGALSRVYAAAWGAGPES